MTKKIRRILLIALITLLIISTYPFIKKKPLEKIEDFKEPDLDIDNANGAHITLIDSQTEALDYRLSLIQTAKHKIDMTYFHFSSDDKTTQHIIVALLDAAKRGVSVNLVLDAKFSGLRKPYIRALNSQENIKVYFYNPINLKKPETIQVSLHNKIVLIDDQWIISGGRNISDTFLSDHKDQVISYDLDIIIHDETKSTQVIHDTKLFFDGLLSSDTITIKDSLPNRKTNTIIKAIRSNYTKDITLDYDTTIKSLKQCMYPVDNITLALSSLSTIKKHPTLAMKLYNTALKLKGEAYIMTPYLVINPNIISSLEKLQQTKPTTLLTNSLYSSPNYPAFSNYLKNRDTIKNTKLNIYEYIGRANTSVHTKAFILGDNVCAVGSMNVDNRSLYINTEQMLLIRSEKLYNQLKHIIKKQEEESVLINNVEASTPKHDKSVSIVKRILMKVSSWVFAPFSYFL